MKRATTATTAAVKPTGIEAALAEAETVLAQSAVITNTHTNTTTTNTTTVLAQSAVITVCLDGKRAEIDDGSKAVTGDAALCEVIKTALRRVQSALFPVIAV